MESGVSRDWLHVHAVNRLRRSAGCDLRARKVTVTAGDDAEPVASANHATAQFVVTRSSGLGRPEESLMHKQDVDRSLAHRATSFAPSTDLTMIGSPGGLSAT